MRGKTSANAASEASEASASMRPPQNAGENVPSMPTSPLTLHTLQ